MLFRVLFDVKERFTFIHLMKLQEITRHPQKRIKQTTKDKITLSTTGVFPKVYR